MDDQEKWMTSVPTKRPEKSLDERLERLFENAEWDARKLRTYRWPVGWALAACIVCMAIGYGVGRSTNGSPIHRPANWDTESATYYVIDVGSDAKGNLFDSQRSGQSFLSGKTKIVIIENGEEPSVIQSADKPGNPS